MKKETLDILITQEGAKEDKRLNLKEKNIKHITKKVLIFGKHHSFKIEKYSQRALSKLAKSKSTTSYLLFTN